VPEAQQRAVVDRVVDGLAVLLVEPDGHEQHVPLAQLPAGVGEGTVVLVEHRDGGLHVVAADEEETARRQADARQRLAALRARRGRGRFGTGRGED
jgi:hypothetical protein